MQTITFVVFVILEVTSRSVLGCGDIDAIIMENDLRANSLKVYSKQISQSSSTAVFNIDGKEKTLNTGSTNLMLVTKNETINKWTNFNYSEAIFRFIQGSPMKLMMYDEAANYHEAYLGNKRMSSTSCQNILCEPFIRLPPYYWFKREIVEQGDEKYTLYSTHWVPSMNKLEPRTVDDEFFPS